MTEVHFDDREAAEEFAGALAEQGTTCVVHRDEFAGEDDAEDAGWIVETDASNVEALAARLGGWVGGAAGSAAEPPPLPQAPRRLKDPSAPRRPADGSRPRRSSP